MGVRSKINMIFGNSKTIRSFDFDYALVKVNRGYFCRAPRPEIVGNWSGGTLKQVSGWLMDPNDA